MPRAFCGYNRVDAETRTPDSSEDVSSRPFRELLSLAVHHQILKHKMPSHESHSSRITINLRGPTLGFLEGDDFDSVGNRRRPF
jgi:hypothetical protein